MPHSSNSGREEQPLRDRRSSLDAPKATDSWTGFARQPPLADRSGDDQNGCIRSRTCLGTCHSVFRATLHQLLVRGPAAPGRQRKRVDSGGLRLTFDPAPTRRTYLCASFDASKLYCSIKAMLVDELCHEVILAVQTLRSTAASAALLVPPTRDYLGISSGLFQWRSFTVNDTYMELADASACVPL